MTTEIDIPQKSVPVHSHCNVLICGGGCAGITAAVSAARHGADVILLERWPSVGGLATNGLVNGWHRSDRQKLVINGLVEESAQRAHHEGWIRKDKQYPHAHVTHWFEPEGMRIVWQRMLDDAGVRTICNLAVGEPILQDGRIRGVLADTKRGRRAFLADIIIDATGDGDVAAQSGVPFEFGRESDGRVQGMTLIYALRGIDEDVRDQAEWEEFETANSLMQSQQESGDLPEYNVGNAHGYVTRACNHGFWNMCPAAGDPLDEEELTRLTAECREKIVRYVKFWREHMPGYADASIEQTAFTMGVRESRRILGRKTLSGEMVLGAEKQPDAIGHGIWMIDIHDPEGSGHTTFNSRDRERLQEGTSYHIPLDMCLNDHLCNLGVVGRCASTTHRGLSSVRVQTHCMVMGQGTGTAAALALQDGCDMHEIDIKRLQDTLREDGVYLKEVPEDQPQQ